MELERVLLQSISDFITMDFYNFNLSTRPLLNLIDCLVNVDPKWP